ncbi:MAG: hypothetical protein LBS09_02555, partial [Bacteroidales bacterium]|nr:hypothetical protein [Bacteroidales bacterium]
MKKLFLLFICLFWAWKADAEPGSASVTVSVTGSGQLASKIAENGTPVADIGHLTVVGGGTLVFSDFYYIASNMNTTLLTLDVSGVSIGNEALGLENCVCLTQLILPPAIGGNFSSNALRGDSSLTAISIPDGVTLLKWDTFR